MEKKILIIDNVRSGHNVGSLFRTADAFGIDEILICGISPYPEIAHDRRLPHVAQKAASLIAKTALGAERHVPFKYFPSAAEALHYARAAGCTIYALEQAAGSRPLVAFVPQLPWALIVGHERSGLSSEVMRQADAVLEIPMAGAKESLNVAVAAGIALYALTYPKP